MVRRVRVSKVKVRRVRIPGVKVRRVRISKVKVRSVRLIPGPLDTKLCWAGGTTEAYRRLRNTFHIQTMLARIVGVGGGIRGNGRNTYVQSLTSIAFFDV